ncbi:hypothetical protein [Streptomyces lucensis]|nr:hypothetical protein [Streptomyces lucensis]
MSGRTDSGIRPEMAEVDTETAGLDTETAGLDTETAGLDAETAGVDTEEQEGDARRARWTAAGTGGLLTLAGLAAALLRLTGSAPALVPAAYALGAAVCSLAAVLGLRGRTRRALWLLIAGTMVMALGDQFD